MREIVMDKQSFWGAAIGTMLEYYDYTLFLIFLPIFAPVFFQADTNYDALIEGYVILLMAFIARPLGGLVFGYFGDRIGRKRSLLMTIYGIAIATFIIGVTPSHQHIGVAAAIIILACKFVQYFCFGGSIYYSGRERVPGLCQRRLFSTFWFD